MQKKSVEHSLIIIKLRTFANCNFLKIKSKACQNKEIYW
ncbi:MAG: hypothetical protein H6Q19_293 [Bacteroidetes bacterium]|nr:hypothetical protein [Bacteroidota bacterium]